MTLKEFRKVAQNDIRVYDKNYNVLVNFVTQLFENKDKRPSPYDNEKVIAVFHSIHTRLDVVIDI